MFYVAISLWSNVEGPMATDAIKWIGAGSPGSLVDFPSKKINKNEQEKYLKIGLIEVTKNALDKSDRKKIVYLVITC